MSRENLASARALIDYPHTFPLDTRGAFAILTPFLLLLNALTGRCTMRGRNFIIATSLFLLGMGHYVMVMAQQSSSPYDDPGQLTYTPLNVPKVPQPVSAPKPAPKANAKKSSPTFFNFNKVFPKISLGTWPPKFLQSTPNPQIQSGPASNGN